MCVLITTVFAKLWKCLFNFAVTAVTYSIIFLFSEVLIAFSALIQFLLYGFSTNIDASVFSM